MKTFSCLEIHFVAVFMRLSTCGDSLFVVLDTSCSSLFVLFEKNVNILIVILQLDLIMYDCIS